MLCSCVKNYPLVWTNSIWYTCIPQPPLSTLTIVKHYKDKCGQWGVGFNSKNCLDLILRFGVYLLPKLSTPQFKAHVPFICTSINPGHMITFLQSICTSALTCSSQKIIRGSIIFPSRTQRSSVIISLSLKSRQFLNWYNFGCLSCVLFILCEEITIPSGEESAGTTGRTP